VSLPAAAAGPADLLAAQAATQPDRPLLILPEALAAAWQEPAVWTYGAAASEVARLARAYAAAGWGPGHRVALLLGNRPAHYLHWLALNAGGASVVPLNPDLTAEEAGWIVAHCGAGLVLATPERRSQALALAGHAAVACPGEPLPEAPPVAAPVTPVREAECAVIYTSGTTGRPKGCLLSNSYFLGWGAWYAGQRGLTALRPGAERLLTPLPTFHVNAMGNSFMGMLATGGAQVILDRFHPRDWWRTAAETGATGFHYLGVMPAMLLALPETPAERAHGMRFGFGGGVHPDHHAAFEARFGVPLVEGWAMTEGGGACALAAAEPPRHAGLRAVGRPGPLMRARIVDDAGGDAVPGEAGELWVQPSGDWPMFAGYLGDPAATAAAVTDGWLRTGDVMRALPDGTLVFVDRQKNIVRRSGENIAAIEVEGVLAADPAVAQVAVVAAADPIRGEEVLAVVVPRGAADAATAAAILGRAAARLAYHKLPGWVVFASALPVTATQKLRRADLGALAADPGADPQAHDLRPAKAALRPR
jgi:acyl-CoA synthetase (AMP-forming)/AMP-acid ligase II